MDSLSASPVRGGIIPNQTRRNRSTPGEEGRIQRGMSPQSGLGEEIQDTRTLRVSPHAHAWGYGRAPSGLESRQRFARDSWLRPSRVSRRREMSLNYHLFLRMQIVGPSPVKPPAGSSRLPVLTPCRLRHSLVSGRRETHPPPQRQYWQASAAGARCHSTVIFS